MAGGRWMWSFSGQECSVLIAQRRFTISVRGTNCAAPGGRRISCQRAREKLARIGLNVAHESAAIQAHRASGFGACHGAAMKPCRG